MTFRPAPGWLSEAVLYQIYPQSFADANGDGIGDFAGITEHLDYLQWLGVGAVWLNPCFASPFKDAGYDISDFMTVAPRYGTEEDLRKLVDAARTRGIRVLLDLVAGHTSDQHDWFIRSANDPNDHRYIWSDRRASGFVASPGSRPGFYLPNFFDVQPALNFGYARRADDEPWRQPVDADGPRANRDALRQIMSHWLDRGVSGFRVDMASSLVKDDPGFVETGRLWTELRHWLDGRYPDAALLSEWGDPAVSVPAGFHVDFFLHFGGPGWGEPFRSLWSTGHGTEAEGVEPVPGFFDPAGQGTPELFVQAWEAAIEAISGGGFASLPTSNHDYARLATGPRTREQLAPAFAFLLTWPTLPAIYYGDEIGMRYVPDLPDVEGSVLGPRYNRAGSRTPMQWDDSPTAGFSTAPPDRLYLPIDPSLDRPTVADQRADPDSLLTLVQRLIALRGAEPLLACAGAVQVLNAGYPFVYIRGARFLVVVNPRLEPATFALPAALQVHPVEVGGVAVEGAEVLAGGSSYGIFAI